MLCQYRGPVMASAHCHRTTRKPPSHRVGHVTATTIATAKRGHLAPHRFPLLAHALMTTITTSTRRNQHHITRRVQHSGFALLPIQFGSGDWLDWKVRVCLARLYNRFAYHFIQRESHFLTVFTLNVMLQNICCESKCILADALAVCY